MQQLLHDLLRVDLRVFPALRPLLPDALVDPLHGFFVGLLLPDAVAAHEDEVDVIRKIKLVGVWVGSDGLFLWLKVSPILVLEVA